MKAIRGTDNVGGGILHITISFEQISSSFFDIGTFTTGPKIASSTRGAENPFVEQTTPEPNQYKHVQRPNTHFCDEPRRRSPQFSFQRARESQFPCPTKAIEIFLLFFNVPFDYFLLDASVVPDVVASLPFTPPVTPKTTSLHLLFPFRQ